MIGRTAMNNPGRKIGFLTDAAPPDKFKHYVDKLKDRFPELTIRDLGPGPTPRSHAGLATCEIRAETEIAMTRAEKLADALISEAQRVLGKTDDDELTPEDQVLLRTALISILESLDEI